MVSGVFDITSICGIVGLTVCLWRTGEQFDALFANNNTTTGGSWEQVSMFISRGTLDRIICFRPLWVISFTTYNFCVITYVIVTKILYSAAKFWIRG